MNVIKPLVLTTMAISLAACSSHKNKLPELDYKTGGHKKVVRLDVPPDLTDPNQGDRFRLPAGGGTVRASDLSKQQKTHANANAAVLSQVNNVRMERDGTIRWLNIGNKQPAEVWPLLKAFWQEQGFTIGREEPAIGLMETDWAENRAKLPGDLLRNLFEKVGLGGVYSTGERDKFTIRLERNNKGGTDVFFSQKGLKEVYTNKQQDTTMWQPRPNEPDLEAAFLARFMQYLGADEKQIKQALSQQQNRDSDLAKLDGSTLVLLGGQERNWRRVALALDRIGLSVINENPQRYMFLVEVAPAESTAVTNKKAGLFSRVFKRKKHQPETKAQPQLVVVAAPGQNGTRVQLINKDGSPYQGSDAQNWLNQLYNQLR